MSKSHRVQFTELPVVDELVERSAEQRFWKLWKKMRRAVSKGASSEVVLATLAWASCSIGMTLLNKEAVSKTHAPVAVVILQMCVTCVMAIASRDLRFGEGWRSWAVSVPPLFVLMMVSSMIALKYVTVGTFVVVRNLGPLVTLVLETMVHRPETLQLDAKTTASVSAIAVGVWLYEAHDLAFSSTGLVFLFMNLGLACGERMVQRHFLAVNKIDVSKPALMLLNNGLGALLAVLVCLVLSPKEFHLLYHACTRKKDNAALAVAASCILGCLISYSGLWLQRLVTATSFMVLGSVTKFTVVLWGMIVLADAHGPLSVMGAVMSVAGGFAYARIQSGK